MQYLILSKDQAKQLMAEVNTLVEEAFQNGVQVGRGDVGEQMDAKEQDAYDDGYGDGHSKGYDEGYNDGAGDSYDDGYSDGYQTGFEEADLRAAEAAAFGAAFDEEPRIHAHCEGERYFD